MGCRRAGDGLETGCRRAANFFLILHGYESCKIIIHVHTSSGHFENSYRVLTALIMGSYRIEPNLQVSHDILHNFRGSYTGSSRTNVPRCHYVSPLRQAHISRFGGDPSRVTSSLGSFVGLAWGRGGLKISFFTLPWARRLHHGLPGLRVS